MYEKEIEQAEAQLEQLKAQANVEIGKLVGRITTLKELSNPKKENEEEKKSK